MPAEGPPGSAGEQGENYISSLLIAGVRNTNKKSLKYVRLSLCNLIKWLPTFFFVNYLRFFFLAQHFHRKCVEKKNNKKTEKAEIKPVGQPPSLGELSYRPMRHACSIFLLETRFSFSLVFLNVVFACLPLSGFVSRAGR
jgi:hypothetical protein